MENTFFNSPVFWLFVLLTVVLTLIVNILMSSITKLPKKFWSWILSLVLGAMFAGWFFLWQRSIPPKLIYMGIENVSIENGSISVADKEVFSVLTSPGAERLYVLIHPRNTERWYLQEKTNIQRKVYNETYWNVEIDFGPSGKDCDLTYDIVILSSRDHFILDVIRGRTLKADPKGITHFPVLNQSDYFVAVKDCNK